MSETKVQRRESSRGYHFFTAYRDNPRNWFLKYCMGLRPRHTAPPLIFGGVLHDAFETYFLKNYNLTAALDAFTAGIETRRGEYEKLEDYEVALVRGPKMLDGWARRWAEHDQEKYTLVEVEKEYLLPMGPDDNFLFSVRCDRVMRDKDTGLYYVFDLKTTGWSISKTYQSVDADDQMTSYIWAMSKAHPEWEIGGAIPDIIYQRAGGAATAERPGTIYRTAWQLQDFEMGMTGTIVEVSQKYKSWKDGVLPWPMLFPRNGRIAGLFHDEFAELSRANLRPGECPPGFVKDDWVEWEEVLKTIKPLEVK